MSDDRNAAAIPLIDVSEAPQHVQEVFSALPAPLNIFRLLGPADGCLRPVVSLGAAVLGRQTLDPRAREMAILRVAAVTGADYEWSQHEAVARALGLVDSHIDAARSGSADKLEVPLRLAVEVGESVAIEPGLPPRLLARCLGWFGEKQTVELVLAASYYLMLARCMVSFRLEPEAPLGAVLLDSVETP